MGNLADSKLSRDTLLYWVLSRAFYNPDDRMETVIVSVGEACAKLGALERRIPDTLKLKASVHRLLNGVVYTPGHADHEVDNANANANTSEGGGNGNGNAA